MGYRKPTKYSKLELILLIKLDLMDSLSIYKNFLENYLKDFEKQIITKQILKSLKQL